LKLICEPAGPKFVPLTVTVVPPVAGPLDGETPVTVGAFGGGRKVNLSAGTVWLVTPPTFTRTSTVLLPPPLGTETNALQTSVLLQFMPRIVAGIAGLRPKSIVVTPACAPACAAAKP